MIHKNTTHLPIMLTIRNQMFYEACSHFILFYFFPRSENISSKNRTFKNRIAQALDYDGPRSKYC